MAIDAESLMLASWHAFVLLAKYAGYSFHALDTFAMTATPAETLATVFFALAVLHTFSVKRFAHWSRQHPKGSIAENVLHFLASRCALVRPIGHSS